MPKLPRKLRTSPTEHSVGAKEKHELLFFVFFHGGSPLPPKLFLSRGARLCHHSHTNDVRGWSFMWPHSERAWGTTPKTCRFLGVGLSLQNVRNGFEGTQPENCGFLCCCINEVVRNQTNYYGAASRYVLILVRTNGAFV
jgi:hypothetical protein